VPTSAGNALDASLPVNSAQRATGGYKRGERQGSVVSELLGHRHAVSANASETQPANLLAVFVADTSETELTNPFGN